MGPPVAIAARAIRSGELVVYPTDTLLGLGASATDPAAVRRLGQVKQRPEGQPISVAVSSLADLEAWADLGPPGLRFARLHLPGPYTLLARPSRRGRRALATALFGPDGSVGFRLPDHPVARELARRAGPITATSANVHGRPPCRTVPEARRTFGRDVAVYLAARPPGSGQPSQLVDLRHGTPRPIARS